MNVPPWAGFTADFPDDQIEADGDIKVFGGRNVAIALGKVFTGLGCTRVSKPSSAGYQGWEFDFEAGEDGQFSCRIQSFHPVFWLQLEDRSLSDGQAYVEVWRKFGNALERDPRFHKILWRPSKEGPPDWDEVTESPDPPEKTFDETFPPSTIRARKVRQKIWPYVVGVWLLSSGLLAPWGELEDHRISLLEAIIGGAILVAAGAFFLFLAIAQGWGTRHTEASSGRKRQR